MTSLLYDLFKNFVLGGLITASISYIGTYMDPLMGAIWWSFPISLIPTIYFLRKVERPISSSHNLLLAQHIH